MSKSSKLLFLCLLGLACVSGAIIRRQADLDPAQPQPENAENHEDSRTGEDEDGNNDGNNELDENGNPKWMKYVPEAYRNYIVTDYPKYGDEADEDAVVASVDESAAVEELKAKRSVMSPPTGGLSFVGAPAGGLPSMGALTGGLPSMGALTGGLPSMGAPTGGLPSMGAPAGGLSSMGGFSSFIPDYSQYMSFSPTGMSKREAVLKRSIMGAPAGVVPGNFMGSSGSFIPEISQYMAMNPMGKRETMKRSTVGSPADVVPGSFMSNYGSYVPDIIQYMALNPTAELSFPASKDYLNLPSIKRSIYGFPTSIDLLKDFSAQYAPAEETPVKRSIYGFPTSIDLLKDFAAENVPAGVNAASKDEQQASVPEFVPLGYGLATNSDGIVDKEAIKKAYIDRYLPSSGLPTKFFDGPRAAIPVKRSIYGFPTSIDLLNDFAAQYAPAEETPAKRSIYGFPTSIDLLKDFAAENVPAGANGKRAAIPEFVPLGYGLAANPDGIVDKEAIKQAYIDRYLPSEGLPTRFLDPLTLLRRKIQNNEALAITSEADSSELAKREILSIPVDNKNIGRIFQKKFTSNLKALQQHNRRHGHDWRQYYEKFIPNLVIADQEVPNYEELIKFSQLYNPEDIYQAFNAFEETEPNPDLDAPQIQHGLATANINLLNQNNNKPQKERVKRNLDVYLVQGRDALLAGEEEYVSAGGGRSPGKHEGGGLSVKLTVPLVKAGKNL